jgi:nucleoside-diphosphate-sugar epimerase
MYLNRMKHTILGSGGPVGKPLAEALHASGKPLRLVSRNPNASHGAGEYLPADLTNPAVLDKAVEGSEVVYVTVGFPYSTKVWQQVWPPFMKATVDACEKHGSKLVFFDNVYLYQKSATPHLTENSAIGAQTQKGKVRQQVAQMVTDAHEQGRVTALIARSADFYGPNVANSLMEAAVLNKLVKGKKAQWLGRKDMPHNFTYTPDAGKATALLGCDNSAYGDVWHLPTDPETLTAEQWIKALSDNYGIPFKGVQLAPGWMVKMIGWFDPIMREMHEMLYQMEQPYFFDSSKFEQKYGKLYTPHAEALQQIVKASRKEQ